jgi:hypothetical protein
MRKEERECERGSPVAAYRQVVFGQPFEVVAGESVSVGDYVLMALLVPVAHQGNIRLRRPSGEFALLYSPTECMVDFTLHGDKNYFNHSDVLVQIVAQKRNGVRLIVWPAPAVTLEMAMDIARTWATADEYHHDYRKGRNMHVNWTCFLNVVAGEKRLAWQINVVSRDDDSRRWGYGRTGWGYGVLIDAATGEVLNAKRPYA